MHAYLAVLLNIDIYACLQGAATPVTPRNILLVKQNIKLAVWRWGCEALLLSESGKATQKRYACNF